jgi:hypothetical protein
MGTVVFNKMTASSSYWDIVKILEVLFFFKNVVFCDITPYRLVHNYGLLQKSWTTLKVQSNIFFTYNVDNRILIDVASYTMVFLI